ncbi:MAG: GDSL-type esterase/lipase family protein, partial [Roseburia sp.]|nr:GDSL-type esterase/lipase family protein [Roseburia sp.]
GDSTVCEFSDSYFYPRYGYGTQIANYLDGSYKVENLAASGRSSKSFPTDGANGSKANYDKLIAGMKPGDALVIGFGHNDEKQGEDDRYTDPNGDYQTAGSFAKSLYDNYVKPAQDAGTEVILCTPIVRRNDSKDHVIADKTVAGTLYKGGDYPAAIRKLGQDVGVTVVDLTALTRTKYNALGDGETLYLHAWLNKKETSVDNTHLNIYGAKTVAWLFANALKDASTSELAKHVVLTAGEPTKATDLVSNPNYVETAYTAPTTKSTLWEDYTCTNTDGTELTFHGTVFGGMGGTSKVNKTNQALETNVDGTMRVASLNGQGKIASAEDGFAMYYYAVPVGKKFTLSAKATITSFGSNSSLASQCAFGLIARDDMYIDKGGDSSILSDYVVAGSLAGSNCFYRKDGKLGGQGTMSVETLAVGSSYDLSIVYNGDGYSCKFGRESAQAGGYDFQLTSVDSDYVYVGMFATRNVDITFSDISLTITEDQGGGNTPTVPDDPTPDKPVVVTTDAVAGGGLETIFAEIPDVADADVTAVKWSGTATGELTGEDLEYLVRDVEGGVRIDIPGLKAGTYTLTVTVKGQDYVAEDLTVKAHDRSGFAHQTVDENNVATRYTEGVGAYKDDGTLKDDAIVLYVTDENKETVSISSQDEYREMTVIGIGNILNSNNSKVNLFLLRAIGRDRYDKDTNELIYKGRPLVIRFVGTVSTPAGVSEPSYSQDSNGEWDGSNGGMVYMLSGANITLEGIGPDATIDGWGISFGADKNDGTEGLAKNFEVRNLNFRNVPEDCVEIAGRSDVPVTHSWVHNCAFYVPYIADTPVDDKHEGDGALDYKCGLYMTSSYNYFDGYHKTSLLGGADSQKQYHATWHHNHWKNVESRAPLARQADMHIYNNLYENQKSYCMSLRANTYIFSEYNTFINCKDVAIDEGSGGVCKSFNDTLTNCTGRHNVETVTDKTQTVTSANLYANFDTAVGSYVQKGDYLLDDTVEKAQANIAAWGGVMKAAADMDTVNMVIAKADDPITPEPADKTALNTAIANAEKAIRN